MKHKLLRYLGRYLTALVLCLILGVSLYSGVSRKVAGNPLPMPFGTGLAVVVSGSMEPALSVGDLIAVKAAEDYQVGDIVVYQSGRDAVVHRIVSLGEETLVTRGDANNADDTPISYDQLLGRVVRILPRVGFMVQFLQSPVGILLVLAAAVALLVLSRRQDEGAARSEQERLRREIEQLKQEQTSKEA